MGINHAAVMATLLIIGMLFFSGGILIKLNEQFVTSPTHVFILQNFIKVLSALMPYQIYYALGIGMMVSGVCYPMFFRADILVKE